MSNKDKNNKVTHQQQVAIKADEKGMQLNASVISSLPSSELFKTIDGLVPNGAQILLEVFVEDSKSQRLIDMKEQEFQHKLTQNGQTYAVYLVVLSFLCALICATLDQTTVAGIFIGAMLIQVLSFFVGKRNS